jgi:hypothetical protein
MNTQAGTEKKPLTAKIRHLPLVRIVLASILVLGILCLGLWALVAGRSGIFGKTPDLTATAISNNNTSCQQLVEEAVRESDKFCKDISTNQLCYGNFSIDTELAQGVNTQFAQRGDVIDVDVLRRLSAAPLDLVRQAWGIAVFKITANLPRSLPGQTVTVLVFGNTTLNKDQPGLQTFYFFSDTGQVICDQVPFDGLLISMPNGVGARFTINGSELILSGTASITASLGGEMNISLYEGSAQITANGESQIFGPGQQVSVPLGGENGMASVGPPSAPRPLSEEELALACTMTGQNCDLQPIPTVSEADLQDKLEDNLKPPPAEQPTSQVPLPSPSRVATALPSPTSFPSATLPPYNPPTRVPPSTRTREPQPTSTYTATVTPTFTDTPTSTPLPTTPPPTTPPPTTLPPTTELPPTTPPPTELPPTTPPPTTPPTCSNIGVSAIIFPAGPPYQLSVDITNSSGEDILFVSLLANWVDSPEEQSLIGITMATFDLWTGSALQPISEHIFFGPGDGRRVIKKGVTKTLIVTFSENLAAGDYSLLLTANAANDGCTIGQSGTLTLP